MLFRLTLISLFESSRKLPGKLQALYYNMPSHLSVEQILSQSSISQNASQYSHSEDENEKLLLDEAEQSYNTVVDTIVSNCINTISNDIEWSFRTPLVPVIQIPEIQDGLSSIGGNYEIFDTRDLSQVNLVYNNVTFQVYPYSEFTNEQRSKTQTRPSKNELD